MVANVSNLQQLSRFDLAITSLGLKTDSETHGMCRSFIALGAGMPAFRQAPAFSAQDHVAIAAWAETMREHGVHTRIDRSHRFLDEAIHVTLGSADGLEWLVHRTPAGAVAVRLWPGLADIVATVPDALAIISAAVVRAAVRPHHRHAV